MTKRALGGTAVCLALGMAIACALNPQPLPPDELGVADGGGGDATSGVPKGDGGSGADGAGDDGSFDAPTGASDGGDADAGPERDADSEGG